MKKLWVLSYLGFLLFIILYVFKRSFAKEKLIKHENLIVYSDRKSPEKVEVVTQQNQVTVNPPPVPSGIYDYNVGPSFSNYRLSSEPKTDLDIVKYLLISYQMRVKNNDFNIPIGTNREITKQLTGDNPSEIVFIEKNDPSIRNGEIIDRWGSPLFFHLVSSKSCDIWSSGPDGKRGTFDDLIEKGSETIYYINENN
jgi:hypothetical protein